MKRLLAAAALMVAGVAGAFVWWTGTSQVPGIMLGSAAAQEAGTVDTSMVAEMSIGNPQADVTVIEYASFTCPHCRSFHAGPFKDLKSEYIDTGKINFIYREVYFDRFGLWAGMLARCTNEDRYFGLVDMLYANQRDWTTGDPATIADNLRKLGRTAGMTDEEVNACLQNGEMAEALVTVYQQNVEEHGVDSTPSFVINGTTYRNMPWDEFKKILDEEIGS